MSFEIGAESFPNRNRGTRRAAAGYPARREYPGLGDIGATTTASWTVGLPKAGNDKDKTRIAYAIRDHDLAMPPRNDATAYANLKSQAVGSATAVGKAWYQAALRDVNAARTTVPTTPTAMGIPKPTAPLINPVPTGGIVFKPTPPSILIQQATDMGLKVQATSDGSVVAVNSDGAVVSKPLPVPVSAVTDKTVLPPNTVQANAPPPANRTPGVFSIFDKLKDALTPATSSGGSSFIPSQGPPVTAPSSADGSAPVYTADMTGGGLSALGELFKNPAVIAGAGVLFYLLFSSSSGRRH